MWNHTPSPTKPVAGAQPTSPPHRPLEATRAAGIGKSVVIKGVVIGAEDLTIDGRVEGRIELRGHSLLIGPDARVQAQVVARTITIMGAVTGNLTASANVEIRKAGSVDGDIDAPRVAMADGAQLCGKIDTLSATKDHRQHADRRDERAPKARSKAAEQPGMFGEDEPGSP